ncbi:DUF2924 domain-containing protein [Minwuia thermotolerans]|uniref:DUF2924 domain-containing protein n=2 Tax=Minwuia thermotolerans TaxID=2056226 RepID=A0A2M9FX37_9PROT|nr:DUF2924 domain-containing protein [Minwuia thermotolerans]PJK28013.1 hypothetical protein CVT23_19245 [Minwuia thermotolerans]
MPSRAIPSSGGDVESYVRALSRDDLVVLWQRRWRRPPPKGLSRRLLECNAAWLMQAEAQGGFTAATRRRLDALSRTGWSSGKGTGRSEPAGNDVRLRPARRALRPGSRLIRQWHGRSHVVEVTDAGFTYEGRHFTSLTAIAREITGAGWSGPRFFGLNTPASGRKPTGDRNAGHSDENRRPVTAMHEGRSDG